MSKVGAPATGTPAAATAYSDVKFVKSIGKKGNGNDKLNGPTFMALHPKNGNIVVASTANNRLIFFERDGTYIQNIGQLSSAPKIDGFKTPMGLAFNNAGDRIIVADKDNHRVQVLTYPDGRYVKTIGKNTENNKGSINGQFDRPCSVAVDSEDNIYVYDAGNSRIQIFTSDGKYKNTIGINIEKITKTLGGIALDGEGYIIVALNHHLQVIRIADGVHTRIIGGEQGANDGEFNTPKGIAFDNAGNIIVADSGNNRVQVLRYSNGNHVRTITKDNALSIDSDEKLASMASPQDVLIDRDGNIIVSTFSATNPISVFSGGAPAPAPVAPVVASAHATTDAPSTKVPHVATAPAASTPPPPALAPAASAAVKGPAVATAAVKGPVVDPPPPYKALDSAGPAPATAPAVAAAGTKAATSPADTDPAAGPAPATAPAVAAAGTKAATSPADTDPAAAASTAPAVAASTLAASTPADAAALHTWNTPDYQNYVPISTIGGPGSGNGQFKMPTFMALDPKTNNIIVVADTGNNRLQVIRLSDGAYMGTIGEKGNGDGQFNRPYGVAFNKEGTRIVVADTKNHRVQVLDYSNNINVLTIGSKGVGKGQFTEPYSVAVHENNIYVLDVGNDMLNSCIQIFNLTNGAHIETINLGSNGCGGIAINNDTQQLIVVEGDQGRLKIFNLTDKQIKTIGKIGSGNGEFNKPRGVAVDGAGNIIVADWGNHRVRVLNKDGGHIHSISVKNAYGVLINDAGNIIVSNVMDNRITYYGIGGAPATAIASPTGPPTPAKTAKFGATMAASLSKTGSALAKATSATGSALADVASTAASALSGVASAAKKGLGGITDPDGQIFKSLRDSITNETADDNMLALIPDVYKKTKEGKDLIYTDKGSSSDKSCSLISEYPIITDMIREFNKINNDNNKQFYLAFCRNIQNNSETANTEGEDEEDDNDEGAQDLLLRLRKNSFLLQLPPTWDYATMGPTLNLRECTKYYAFSNVVSCQDYNYNQEDMDKTYNDKCKDIMTKINDNKITEFRKIFKMYNNNVHDFELFNLIIEIIGVVVNYSEYMKILDSDTFNKKDMVEAIKLIVDKFTSEPFIIQKFPFPYLEGFFDTLDEFTELVMNLYKWLSSGDNDKILRFDITNYRYFGTTFTGSDHDTLPFVSIASIRYVFMSHWVKIKLMSAKIKEIIDEHYNNNESHEKILTLDDKIKKTSDGMNNLTKEIANRRRSPILPICNNIIEYLKNNKELYTNAIKYSGLNMIDMNMSFNGNNTHQIRDKIDELISKLDKYTDNTAENIVCIKFIRLLLFIQKNIQNRDMDTGNLANLFRTAMKILTTINTKKCIKEKSKLKIYEYVKLINDIFIFIINDINETKDLTETDVHLFNSLNTINQATYNLLKKKGGIERDIPNLVRIVKELDDIIKTCNEANLKTTFNEFRDNLTYTSVTDEDIINFNTFKALIDATSKIMCNSTSGGPQEDKAKSIKKNADSVEVILNYIKRYTSPGQHKGVDESSKDGGKKHRKRYIKNKQNNNKNDNITMKKQRRNRKRAPVTKTIRNKKEQE
jgi:DNA-binding beta-propeller fold protein YncE